MKHSSRGRSTHLWIVTTEPRASNRLTVVVPQQISMSARCPLRVLGKRVQTQRVRSPVSTARTVTESLRMDSGATVRLVCCILMPWPGLAWSGLAFLAWLHLSWPGLALSMCVRALVRLPLSLFKQSREIERPDNHQSFAIEGDSASWIRLDVNSIRCDGFDPKAPNHLSLKIPKYSFQTSHHSWIVEPSASGTTHPDPCSTQRDIGLNGIK